MASREGLQSLQKALFQLAQMRQDKSKQAQEQAWMREKFGKEQVMDERELAMKEDYYGNASRLKGEELKYKGVYNDYLNDNLGYKRDQLDLDRSELEAKRNQPQMTPEMLTELAKKAGLVVNDLNPKTGQYGYGLPGGVGNTGVQTPNKQATDIFNANENTGIFPGMGKGDNLEETPEAYNFRKQEELKRTAEMIKVFEQYPENKTVYNKIQQAKTKEELRGVLTTLMNNRKELEELGINVPILSNVIRERSLALPDTAPQPTVIQSIAEGMGDSKFNLPNRGLSALINAYQGR
jgi:hypothetical protein